MSLTGNKLKLLIQRPLMVYQARFSLREKIRKRPEPDKDKKFMLAATQPYIKRVYSDLEESCKGVEPPVHELHPLEIIYAKELIEEIEKSDIVLFVQYNYTPFISDRVYKNNIIKTGCKINAYNNRVYREAFRQIGYKPDISSLFHTRNVIITGPEESLAPCVNALKRIKEYLLLAAFVNKSLHDIGQLEEMIRETNIDNARASLISTLDAPAFYLSHCLEEHSRNMDQQPPEIVLKQTDINSEKPHDLSD